jgi:hydroxyacylglutathione hydrolase
MLSSLDRLAALPGDTQVCCAHEYTLSNLRFALAVEPHNADLLAYHARCQQTRANGQPTLPSTLSQELAINPFMRSRQASVVQAVQQRSPGADDEVAVFAQLREWKNQF